MNVIPVKTSSGTYQVRIGRGLLAGVGEIIKELGPAGAVAVVTDSNVAALHLPALQESLKGAGINCHTYVFPAGEPSKTLSTVADILNFMAEKRITRGDLVVALGGGVVGDIAGFAAAIYLRGIRVVQLPTTFLAAIDSSVGGKTGVDLPAGKNLAGAFKQPSMVICDVDTLKTLPMEVFHDGTAEAIKYGVIADRQLFDMLAAGGLEENLEAVIARCVQIKADIVGRDEFDRGERALLNLGHTIGHAVEKCSNFAVSHGRGVAIGMVMIASIAAKQGWTTEDFSPAIATALQRYGLPTDTQFTPEELIPFMSSDKKREGGTINFVIPTAIGRCVTHSHPVAELPALF